MGESENQCAKKKSNLLNKIDNFVADRNLRGALLGGWGAPGAAPGAPSSQLQDSMISIGEKIITFTKQFALFLLTFILGCVHQSIS